MSTQSWKKDLEKQIEAKTGTKDFANAAEKGAILQRISDLETAWEPLLDYLAYIAQEYQAEDKVLKACFDANKANQAINFYIGFLEPGKEIGYITADLAFTVKPEAKSTLLQVISWNGIGFRDENKKETFTPAEVDLLIEGLNKYVAKEVANGGLQKRHIRKEIDLSPKP